MKSKFAKRLMINVAQLLVVIILLPACCFVIQLVSPNTTGEYLLGVFSETNYFKYFFGLIQSSVTAYSFTENLGVYAETFADVADTCVAEASITGCCIFIFRILWRLLKVMDGVWPILPMAAATVVSCLILKVFENDPFMLVMANLFMAALSFVFALFYSSEIETGRIFTFKRAFRVFFSIGFQAVTAIVMTSYFCILIFIMNHQIETWAGIIYTLCIIAILIVLSIFEDMIAN